MHALALAAQLALTQLVPVINGSTITASGQAAASGVFNGTDQLIATVGTVTGGGSITFQFCTVDPLNPSACISGQSVTGSAISSATSTPQVLTISGAQSSSVKVTWTVSATFSATVYLSVQGIVNANGQPCTADGGCVAGFLDAGELNVNDTATVGLLDAGSVVAQGQVVTSWLDAGNARVNGTETVGILDAGQLVVQGNGQVGGNLGVTLQVSANAVDGGGEVYGFSLCNSAGCFSGMPLFSIPVGCYQTSGSTIYCANNLLVADGGIFSSFVSMVLADAGQVQTDYVLARPGDALLLAGTEQSGASPDGVNVAILPANNTGFVAASFFQGLPDAGAMYFQISNQGFIVDGGSGMFPMGENWVPCYPSSATGCHGDAGGTWTNALPLWHQFLKDAGGSLGQDNQADFVEYGQGPGFPRGVLSNGTGVCSGRGRDTGWYWADFNGEIPGDKFALQTSPNCHGDFIAGWSLDLNALVADGGVMAKNFDVATSGNYAFGSPQVIGMSYSTSASGEACVGGLTAPGQCCIDGNGNETCGGNVIGALGAFADIDAGLIGAQQVVADAGSFVTVVADAGLVAQLTAEGPGAAILLPSPANQCIQWGLTPPGPFSLCSNGTAAQVTADGGTIVGLTDLCVTNGGSGVQCVSDAGAGGGGSSNIAAFFEAIDGGNSIGIYSAASGIAPALAATGDAGIRIIGSVWPPDGGPVVTISNSNTMFSAANTGTAAGIPFMLDITNAGNDLFNVPVNGSVWSDGGFVIAKTRSFGFDNQQSNRMFEDANSNLNLLSTARIFMNGITTINPGSPLEWASLPSGVGPQISGGTGTGILTITPETSAGVLAEVDVAGTGISSQHYYGNSTAPTLTLGGASGINGFTVGLGASTFIEGSDTAGFITYKLDGGVGCSVSNCGTDVNGYFRVTFARAMLDAGYSVQCNSVPSHLHTCSSAAQDVGQCAIQWQCNPARDGGSIGEQAWDATPVANYAGVATTTTLVPAGGANCTCDLQYSIVGFHP